MRLSRGLLLAGCWVFIISLSFAYAEPGMEYHVPLVRRVNASDSAPVAPPSLGPTDPAPSDQSSSTPSSSTSSSPSQPSSISSSSPPPVISSSTSSNTPTQIPTTPNFPDPPPNTGPIIQPTTKILTTKVIVTTPIGTGVSTLITLVPANDTANSSFMTSTATVTASGGVYQNDTATNGTGAADNRSILTPTQTIIIGVSVGVAALVIIGAGGTVLWRTRKPSKKPVALNFDDDDMTPHTQMLVEDPTRPQSTPAYRYRRPLSGTLEPSTPTTFTHESFSNPSNPSTQSFLISGRTTPVPFDDGPTTGKNAAGGGWFRRSSPAGGPLSVGRTQEELEMSTSGDLGARRRQSEGAERFTYF